MKKLVGFLICMLFLFLVFPTIQGANNIYYEEASISKTNDANFPCAFIFVVLYGIIEYNGEVFDYLLGNCYNITPIKVRCIYFGIDGYSIKFQNIIVTTDDTQYMYISKDLFNWHGFVSKHLMFLRLCEWATEN